MIGVFKQKNPGNILVLFILGILIKLPLFFGMQPAIVTAHDGILYKKMIDFIYPFVQVFPATPAIIAFLLLFLQAQLLNLFINANRVMNRANFLPGMAYLLITSFLPEFNHLSAPLVVSGVYLYIFIILFRASHQKITRGDIFNSGLLLGIASFIFLPSLLFAGFMIFALLTLRPFKLSEMILLVLGVITPYYFYFAILFLSDHLSLFAIPYKEWTFGIIKQPYAIWLSGGLFLILFPLLAGLYYAQSLSGRTLIHVRKTWRLFAFYILFTFIIALINHGQGYENFVLCLLPIAAFHGYGYFYTEWKLYPRISFWLAIIFIIALQIYGPRW